MPHPKRLVNPKIPRFSNIIKSDAPALQSPYAHENAPVNGLPAPAKQPFNPKVAAYTFAFVSVLVGGLYVGAKSKDIMESREVFVLIVISNGSDGKHTKVYPLRERLQSKVFTCVVNDSLKKLRKTLLQQRERLEDQIAMIRVQSEDEERRKRRT